MGLPNGEAEVHEVEHILVDILDSGISSQNIHSFLFSSQWALVFPPQMLSDIFGPSNGPIHDMQDMFYFRYKYVFFVLLLWQLELI